MSDDTSGEDYRRAAAGVSLIGLLKTKTKGDRITAREVLEATGYPIDTWRSKIKTWERRNRLVLVAVPNDGYRICSDIETADVAIRGSQSASRKERKNLRVLVVTDQSKLDDAQLRRHNWLMQRVAARAARAEQDVKDARQEFKLTGDRVPLRILEKK